MKICFVDLFMDLTCSGGSMHSLDLYAATLAEAGHDVSILTFHPQRNIGFERDKKPYKIIEEPLNISSSIDLAFGVEKALKLHESDGFDVFHIHDPRLLLAGALYRRSGGKVPVVGDLNTYLFQMKNLGNSGLLSLPLSLVHSLRLSMISKHVDLLFPVSPYVREVYVKKGVEHKKLITVPDGFDFGIFQHVQTGAKKHEQKKSDSAQQKRFRLLYVGRLEKTKGVDVTIRALAILNQTQSPDAHTVEFVFNIVGEGPERANLESLANELGVSGWVKFHGFVDYASLSKLYSVSDAFVHAARWEEPFGRAIVEAMHFGLPIVAANIGAPPWVANGACVTFEPENIHGLVVGIERVYGEESLKEKLSESAFKRATEFEVEKTTSKFLEAYKLLGIGNAK
ncbi:MAG: glycosyltransferase family 4 protein [Candidatus Micrarchaeia archaeon]